MKQEWMSLGEVAQARRMSLEDVRTLAEREHWPTVFTLHETFVLPPAATA